MKHNHIAQETYFLNKEKTIILPAGHPDRASLLVRKGSVIPAGLVSKFHFKNGIISGVGDDGLKITKKEKAAKK